MPLQGKGGFLWGFDDDTTGWETAQDDVNVFEYEGLTTNLTGRFHTYRQFISPPDYWERQRSYISFYTSGFLDSGWVESVKLRLFLDEGVSLKEQGGTFTALTPEKNWRIDIYTVSGMTPRNKEYTPSYGFGDGLNYADWGATPANQQNSLSQRISSLTWEQMYTEFSGGSVDYVNGIATRILDRWIEFRISPEYINPKGETHFRIVHRDESANIPPTGGVYNHHEFINYHTAENTSPPELELNYVSPGNFTMGNLRLCDLSIQRLLQYSFDLDVTLSGIQVLDGYPQNSLEFSKDKNVSLEHIDTSSQNLELYGRINQNTRRFLVDIVCKNRGDLLDIEERVVKNIHGIAPLYDFRYGFIYPPEIGKIQFLNVNSFDIQDELSADREMYHSVVLFEAISFSKGL